jgi:hypothetical protein
MPEVFRPQTLPPSWFVRPHSGSILNQILRPIQRFPQCLKSVRIIASAFLPDGCVPKAADGGTKTFDRLVPNPERFRQSIDEISRFFHGSVAKEQRSRRGAKDILGESIWRSMGPAGPYSPRGVLMLAINRLQRFGVSPSTLYRNAAGPESPKMLMM